MFKLKKYLKPFIFSMILCFGLVFVQSQSELFLPDKMSDMVTYGIQGQGIEEELLEVVDPRTFQGIIDVTDSTKQSLIINAYDYYEENELPKDVQKRFPRIKNAYVLKKMSKDDIKNLESVMKRSTFLYYNLYNFHNHPAILKDFLDKNSIQLDGLQDIKNMSVKDYQTLVHTLDKQIHNMGETSFHMSLHRMIATQYGYYGYDLEHHQQMFILKTGAIMLLVAFFGSAAAMCVTYLSSRVGAGFANHLRQDVFEKVLSFSHHEYQEFSTASLMTRTTNDITQVQSLVIMSLRIVLFAPMMGLGALYKALTHYSSLSWIIMVILIFIAMIMMIVIRVVLPRFKKIQSFIDELNAKMREMLSGILVIRAFGNERYSEQRFANANQDLTKITMFVNRMMASLMPLMTFVMNIASVLIIWVGAKQIDLGNMAIGDIMAFIQYGMYIMMAFVFIAMIFVMIPRAEVSAQRIAELLNTQVDIADANNAKELDSANDVHVSFHDVSFGYHGAQENILNHLNFDMEPGKITAIIGSTGSGKSTLVRLIPRFYDVTEGSITVNGIDIRDLKQHDLREVIGFVPQTTTLLSGTIQSNLSMGNDSLTDDDLKEALRIAQALPFVEDKEKGLEEELSQGGSNLSGGQKQRLAISRAIAKKPKLLILDDSFSALDYKTDAALRNELSDMIEKDNTTVLIVAQRITSIMHADQIIVLDKGSIVGKGKHDDLMETCQVYQEIAYSQLEKEELVHA